MEAENKTLSYEEQTNKVNNLFKRLKLEQHKIIICNPGKLGDNEYRALNDQFKQEKIKLDEMKRSQLSLFKPGSIASVEATQLTNKK